MAVETIDYNGYRLEVVPVGKGWRVSIYPPDSTLALRESRSCACTTTIRLDAKLVRAQIGRDRAAIRSAI
jgi:hypothetical protein